MLHAACGCSCFPHGLSRACLSQPCPEFSSMFPSCLRPWILQFWMLQAAGSWHSRALLWLWGQNHFSPDLTGSISIPQLQPWTSLSVCPDMPETQQWRRGQSWAAALGQSCVVLLRLGKSTDEIAAGIGKQMLTNLLVPC